MSSPDQDIAAPSEPIADLDEEWAAFRAAAEKMIACDSALDVPREEFQRAFGALVKLYTVRFQYGERWFPFEEPKDMPATAAMVTITAMLKAVNIEVFELSMFQAFSGVRGDDMSNDDN